MKGRLLTFVRLIIHGLLILVIVGCGSKVDLYTGLSEQDANELVSSLIQGGMTSEKVIVKQGFTVRVFEKDLANAMILLNSQGLPRNSYRSLGEIFKKEGVVSTPIEERGRYLFALSQELENTLSKIDGVILARVHPVLPERLVPSEPAISSSCSVLIKHRREWDPVMFEDRIRRLLLSSIPGLARAHPSAVSIVFVPVGYGEATTQRFHADGEKHITVIEWLFVGVMSLMVLVIAGFLVWKWRVERSRRDNAVHRRTK